MSRFFVFLQLSTAIFFQAKVPKMSGATPKRKFRLDGVFPPLPTPFDKDDNIDFNAWKKNVALWEKIPFKGNFPFFRSKKIKF